MSGVIEITATDCLHPIRRFQPGNTVSMYISQAPYAELVTYFHRLSEGADPTYLDTLIDMPFGIYGHLADKYGIHWTFQGQKQINSNP
jgi:uncharacterized glyoxalase superfamily protein PhnB